MRALNFSLLFVTSFLRAALSDAAAGETQPKPISTDLPRLLRKVNAVVLDKNLAVLDGDWESGEISTVPFLPPQRQLVDRP